MSCSLRMKGKKFCLRPTLMVKKQLLAEIGDHELDDTCSILVKHSCTSILTILSFVVLRSYKVSISFLDTKKVLALDLGSVSFCFKNSGENTLVYHRLVLRVLHNPSFDHDILTHVQFGCLDSYESDKVQEITSAKFFHMK